MLNVDFSPDYIVTHSTCSHAISLEDFIIYAIPRPDAE